MQKVQEKRRIHFTWTLRSR